ncbi:uncharacterized protein LOC131858302 [Cryptomeria japonica]|uniref:uncharacterized protein LOC131858302 n=1 Tax=Cryptomeria japonica TaxID=3369 RepID=UPI0027DA63C8|nr:uncharacterized protein LOC131858302 [Cryptomeria japonica]
MVKEAKLKNIRAQFEGLKMKEEEKIVDYLQRIDEIVNAIRGLGEYTLDEVIVKKVLRSLTSKYDTKVSCIEEAKDLKTFSMDELFGSLSTYEMRTVSGETSEREVAFNTTKKGKEVDNSAKEDDSDTIEANFVRKLKKGSGKYKGKLQFKCFSCGKIGHFATKCPYGEKGDDANQNVKSYGKEKVTKSFKPRRRNFRRESNLCTIENDATNEESVSNERCSEDEREVNLLMVREELDKEHMTSDDEEEVEAEVDLEGELVSVLEELRKVRK